MEQRTDCPASIYKPLQALELKLNHWLANSILQAPRSRALTPEGLGGRGSTYFKDEEQEVAKGNFHCAENCVPDERSSKVLNANVVEWTRQDHNNGRARHYRLNRYTSLLTHRHAPL
jgi:hypothetical protein